MLAVRAGEAVDRPEARPAHVDAEQRALIVGAAGIGHAVERVALQRQVAVGIGPVRGAEEGDQRRHVAAGIDLPQDPAADPRILVGVGAVGAAIEGGAERPAAGARIEGEAPIRVAAIGAAAELVAGDQHLRARPERQEPERQPERGAKRRKTPLPSHACRTFPRRCHSFAAAGADVQRSAVCQLVRCCTRTLRHGYVKTLRDNAPRAARTR